VGTNLRNIFVSNRYRPLDLLISSICIPFHGNLNNLFWFAGYDGKKYTQLSTAAGQKLKICLLPRPKCAHMTVVAPCKNIFCDMRFIK